MARNFLSYPAAPYQGQLSSKPFNGPRGQQKGLLVPYFILWPNYTVAGQALGNAQPNFTIDVNLNAAGPNTVAQGWTIQSVYIDNEAVNFPVYVFFPSTGAAISCPPNASGWYSVFTVDRLALITAIGISNIDIANGAQTNVFFTDVAMVPYLDQENQTAVAMGLTSPSINFGAGGGALLSIAPVGGISGSCYVNGNLTISGGGGQNATCHGVLDQYGRFTSVVIDNPGTGYTGFPVITATSAQTLFPVWNSGTNYPPGQTVIYLPTGLLYTAKFNSGGALPTSGATWAASGIVAQTIAQFNSTFSSLTGGQTISASSNFGTFAVGDQFKNYLSNNVHLNGVFQDNLFGTPYGSGFIYITNMFVNQLVGSAGEVLWQLQDSAGDVLFPFQSSSIAGPIMQFQRSNIKIPATLQLQLAATATPNLINLAHSFAYTYAQF